MVQILDNNSRTEGWVYTGEDDQVELYDADGRLTKITYRQGQILTLSYDLTAAEGGDDDSTTLDSVEDYTGDTLTFTYDSKKRIINMTGPEGEDYRYEYGTANNLARVYYPDQTPSISTDNPFKQYHYESTQFPDFLTGITDENGNRYVTWTFDSNGRATSSFLGGGVDQYTFVYGASNVTVTAPLGRQTVYTFQSIHGVKYPQSEQRTASANYSPVTQSSTYDAFGNRTSLEDTNGNVTSLSFDARGLQDERTEAVGTVYERTLLRTWHPDFRLPLSVTEPGRTTTYTYDTYGNVLTKTETDTTSQSTPYSTVILP